MKGRGHGPRPFVAFATMPPMEISRSSTAADLSRCPFCHEGVGDADEQVACQRCLARHHRACWGEGGRCSSCQAPTPLVQASSPAQASSPEVIGPVEGAGQRAPDDARRAASRLLDAAEVKEDASASWFLSYPTLGFHGIAVSESAFKAHCLENAEEERPLPYVADDLKKRLAKARTNALGKQARETRGALFTLGFCVLAVGIFFGLGSLTGTMDERKLGISILMGVYVGFCALLASWLHVFREAVRRHEFEQFYAKLVGDAVSPLEIQRISDLRQKAWSERRSEDVWTSIIGGAFFGPILLLPYVAVRARGALALHAEHEKLLDGVATARKDASA